MFTKRHTRQRLVVAALTFAALLMGALLLRTELVDTTLQSIVYDKAIDIGNPPLANQVTIIALDDRTVDQYRYPLPHQAYTDLLRALQPQNPSVIGTGLVEVPSIGYVVMAVFWWIILQGYMLVEEQITVARTRNTFGRFVTPSVARTIIDREEAGKLALGGEEKRVTVLFGDIRGFTTISEGLTPGILLGHLNRYFDGMVDIVNPMKAP
ncbi:MAG: CHASE2 domain-containing protein [Chloroflexota bacterium]|nr:CHASE2 domain-containing protein [Chloroflexota bacterium]